MRRNNYVTECASVLTMITAAWLATGLRTPLTSARAGERFEMTSGIVSPAQTATRRLPKLRTRVSNPHLIEDENRRPFFVAGVCPQNILHWSAPDQMDAYFADREV